MNSLKLNLNGDVYKQESVAESFKYSRERVAFFIFEIFEREF